MHYYYQQITSTRKEPTISSSTAFASVKIVLASSYPGSVPVPKTVLFGRASYKNHCSPSRCFPVVGAGCHFQPTAQVSCWNNARPPAGEVTRAACCNILKFLYGLVSVSAQNYLYLFLTVFFVPIGTHGSGKVYDQRQSPLWPKGEAGRAPIQGAR